MTVDKRPSFLIFVTDQHPWDHLLTVYPGRPYGELYDLRRDPDQYVNLWDDQGYRTRRLELQAVLLDRMGQTDRVLFRRLCHA